MRKYILFITALFLGTSIQAQSYNFTLIKNSNYNYTVAAIPDFDSGVDTPNLESFGFTIMLQDGASIDEGTINFHYLSLDSVTIFTAAQLDSSDPGMDRSANLVVTPSGVAMFPAHPMDQVINLVTFDVLGSPTTGEISILDNGSALAGAAGGQFDSFLVIDETGGTNPTNLYGGQTAPSSHSFSTLGLEDDTLANELSIYPNPASKFLNISAPGLNIQALEMFDLLGKMVLTTDKTDQIRVDKLPAGVYLLKVYAERGELTKKVIVE